MLLILSVSLSVLISTIATTSYLIHMSEKNTHDKNIVQIKGLSNYISEYLNNAYTLNYQLSLNPLVINQLKNSNVNWKKRVAEYNSIFDTKSELGANTGPELLVKIHKEYDFVDLVYVQDKNGDQTGKSYGQLGHRKDRWWFKEFTGKRKLKPFISKSYYSLTGDKPVASIFHPVTDKGNFLGIIGLDIVFSDLQNAIETYLNTKDMYSIVLDTEGVVIAHPNNALLKEIYNLRDLTKLVLKRNSAGDIVLDSKGNHITKTVDLEWAHEISDAASLALHGKSGYLKNIDVAGVSSTVYYEPVALPSDVTGVENYAVLLIQGQTAIVKAKAIIIISTVLLIIFTITFLFTVFHARFQKFIIGPLQVLVDSMNNVDIDNFQIIELNTDDEFSLMANTYNDLRKNLSLANRQLMEKIETLKEREAGFRTLSEIGLALTTEDRIDNLMDLVLMEAMRLTRSDGGTLYIHDVKNRQLRFEILCNESMNVKLGGVSGNRINFPPVPLYKDGKPNFSNVSSYSALTGEVVNIPDVYHAEGFDFSGMRSYDKNNGYHSESMLVIPMMNKDKELIGVLQLINAQKKKIDEIIPYSKVYENLIETLAYQSAIKMTNVQLNIKLKELLYSIIKSIATAIDEKSPFTGKHISHVFHLTMIIANKINQTDKGYFKDVHFSYNELEELKLAAWMHDIGKITTPESLLNKGTKLKLFRDGIELIETRFRLIQKTFENNTLIEKVKILQDKKSNRKKIVQIENNLNKQIDRLKDDISFIKKCNLPGEILDKDKLDRLKEIASENFSISDGIFPYLLDEELENLSIISGTLNEGERKIIEDHVRMTQVILDHISFPKYFSRVADYASMHHEKPDGTGYHRGLKGSEIPLQSRIIAIADIFEALTTKERPYREGLEYEEVLKILKNMKDNNGIDPEIYNLIVNSNIGEIYFKEIIESD